MERQPLKLLFVDDDPILREFAVTHLASDAQSVIVAADGEEALAAMRRNCPDLLLLDLRMPRVDGFAVLEVLRDDPTTERLPVIVITGQNDSRSIDQAFAKGASAFVTKPINWQLLAYEILYVDRNRRLELELRDRIEQIEHRERELEATTAALNASLDAAAAGSRAKSEFLAAMSHELRTPLNAIIGFSEILDTEAFGPVGNPRYRDYVHCILESGSHLLGLVNDVLEYSRSEIGNHILQENEFDLSSVIQEAVRVVSRHAELGQVDLRTEQRNQEIFLRADQRRLRQVLINLITNGIKFTPEGGFVVVSARETSDGIEIAVKDSGIGISEEDIPTALELFGQVDSRLARKYDGVGLGLPLAKQIAELHGGRLQIDSLVGVGTTVTLILPASRVVPAEPSLAQKSEILQLSN